MVKKPNFYKKVISILDDLHRNYPEYGLGRHLATALCDYGDMWGLSDKEMHFALTKYQTELALDLKGVAHEDYVDKIVKDAQNLDDILKEEDDDEDNWDIDIEGRGGSY